MLILSVLAVPASGQAGKLDDVRKEVRGSEPRDPEDHRDDDYRDEVYDDDGPSFLGSLLWAIFGPSEPAYDRRDVYFYGPDSEQLELEYTPQGPSVSAQLSASATYLDPGFVQTQFSGQLQLLSALEVSASYDLFTERLDDGSTDRIGLGRVGLGLALGSPELGVRLIPGVNYLRFNDSQLDGSDASGGEVFGRLEVFPGPVVIRLEGRVGVLDEANTRSGAVEVGWRLIDQLELYLGWSEWNVGDVSLPGPRAGLKVWL